MPLHQNSDIIPVLFNMNISQIFGKQKPFFTSHMDNTLGLVLHLIKLIVIVKKLSICGFITTNIIIIIIIIFYDTVCCS